MNDRQKKDKIKAALKGGPLSANEVKQKTGLLSDDIRRLSVEMINTKEIILADNKRVQLPKAEKVQAAKAGASTASAGKKPAKVTQPVEEDDDTYSEEELDEMAEEYATLEAKKSLSPKEKTKFKQLERILDEAGRFVDEDADEDAADDGEDADDYTEEEIDEMAEEYDKLQNKPKLSPSQQARVDELFGILDAAGRFEDTGEDAADDGEDADDYTEEELDEMAEEYESLTAKTKTSASQKARITELEEILEAAGRFGTEEAADDDDFDFGDDIIEDDDDEHGDDDDDETPAPKSTGKVKKPSNAKAEVSDFSVAYKPIDQLNQVELETRIVACVDAAEELANQDELVTEALMRQVARYRKQLRKRFDVEM